MIRLSSSRVALAATLPVLIAGCGTGAVSTAGLSGTQKAIATTISNFQSDAETNDTSKLCSTDLAPALVRSLSTGGHTCTSVLSSQLKIVDAFSLSLANDSIKVTGNNATAVVQDTYSGKTTHQDTITLVKSGTVWKISGIAG